jgi:2-oxoglutarate-dependent dioxygenase
MLASKESSMTATLASETIRTRTPIADCASGVQPTASQVADFTRQGWTVLRGAVRPDCVAALREEVLEVVRARNLPDSYLAQAQEYLAGSHLDRWVNSPTLRATATALLGAQAHVYMQFTAVKGPQRGAFGFHQDNNYTRHRTPRGCSGSLNCWLALVPMRVANGALRVVPASQTDGVVAAHESAVNSGHREVSATPTSWIDVAMEPGDLCIFDRDTVHGSGPNSTNEPRVAYAVQFHSTDSEAFFDERWESLLTRPRFSTKPVARLSDQAQYTE